MGLGRRKVQLHDASAWVFNRMADVYDARPAYPAALIDALAESAGQTGARILDVGAGIGHLALPLAARAYEVVALEPAQAMLARLEERAAQQGLTVRTVHAAAESMPLEARSFDLVIVADALHFLDAELTGREVRRVLAKGGSFALVTCELARTPFMDALIEVMEQSAPRRPRDTSRAVAQLLAMLPGREDSQQTFVDDQPVDAHTLERILGSISYIGPAMNEERSLAFRKRVRALTLEPRWARNFSLRVLRTTAG